MRHDKQTVLYRTDRLHFVMIGHSALVVPMSHPSPDVTGDGETPARTSTVTCVDDETEEFWTENTHYVPWHNEGNLS